MSAAHASAARAPAFAPPAMQGKAPPRRRADSRFLPPLASLAAIPALPAVQRKCGACAAEEKDEMPVQPRLEVGPVGDRFEREADAIAGKVMAMRGGGGDAAPAAPAVQRASADQGGGSIAASHGELTGGGAPLPAATRGFFEERMGRDLGDVRVHQGGGSEALNRSISARAFTYRDHIWLGGGESAAPSFTMAHELAHVMQQTAPGPVGPGAQRRMQASPAPASAQRAPPVAAAAAAAPLTITAAIGKCIIGAVLGVVFDAAVQAALHAIREGTLRVWEMTVNYCSLILSAAVGCVAAPISAAVVEPAILARSPSIAARQGTTLGWLLLKAAAAARMAVPKGVVKALLKLGCIDGGTASKLGGGGGDEPPAPSDIPATPTPAPAVAPPGGGAAPPGRPAAPACEKRIGDVKGNERILMKVNTTEFADDEERTRLDIFADGVRPTAQSIVVHGLASTDGPAWFNEQLSCTRAMAGRDELLKRGIPGTRIAGVFQHGEVEGAKEWQRSVVFELIEPGPAAPAPGGTAPSTPAAPGGTAPAPSTPASPGGAAPSTPAAPAGAVAPKVTLRKLRFTSDHALLLDHDKDWSLAGAVAKPEWTSEKPGGAAAPISQTKATPLAAEAEVDIEPLSALPAPVTLRGEGTADPLNLRGTANLGGGLGQKIAVQASKPLPDRIETISGQNVYWLSEIAGAKQMIAVSQGHEVHVTHGQPRGWITSKRIRTAIGMTAGVGNNPHKIIGHQVESYGFYNLKTPIWGEPWQFADVIPPLGAGSDCQSIIRFMIAVNDAIGLPGETKGLAVYADPSTPTVPKTAELNYYGGAKGGMFDYPGYMLLDSGGNANNFEATMEYKLGKSEYFPRSDHFEKYYPGGIPSATEGKDTLESVLKVFQKMVWVHWVQENGQWILKEDEIHCYNKREWCDLVKYKPSGGTP